jgi:phosphopantothenoylcysteine decarboxylase/phosphopantothenate--cysteine ligase
MLLATKAPTLYVPSMNTAMLENGITQRNIRTLAEFGKHFAESDSGLLACGDVGKGRYPDEEVIIEKLESILAFANKAASITTSRHGAIPAMPTLAEVEG